MRHSALFELSDIACCPSVFKELETDFLSFLWSVFPIYKDAASILSEALKDSCCKQVLDLCSGSGGPLLSILPYLSSDVHILLSDIHPNTRQIENVKQLLNKHIEFVSQAVDVTKVSPKLKGFRTLFTSFHHFNTSEAMSILADAVKNSEGIAVFEITKCDVVHVLRELFLPLLVLSLTPFIRPFKWKRIIWTYVIPIMPFFILFNGMISNLKTYTISELHQLTASPLLDGFLWEFGSQPSFFGGLTYLLGVKRKTHLC